MKIKAQWALMVTVVVLLCLVGWGGSRAQARAALTGSIKL